MGREAGVGVVNAAADVSLVLPDGSLDGVTAFARSVQSSAALSLSPRAAAATAAAAAATAV